MHELGIVFHIIRDVEDVATANGIARISRVTLELGEVSGVVPELLADAWAWSRAKHETVRDAELAVETVPAVSYCEDCGREFGTVANGKTCPVCGGANTYLLRGQEVLIKEIETPDDAPASAGPSPCDAVERDAVDAAHPMHIG